MEQVYIGTTNYGRHYLSAPAAAAWFRMVRDGCPTGGITDALRTRNEQITLFTKHFTTNYASSAKIDRRQWNGQVWYRAYRPGTKTPWPSAATPDTPQARHQWGLSLDLNGTTKAWVRAHGHRYGWIKDVVPGEDWHMEYQANRDAMLASNPGATTGGTLPSVNPDTLDPISPRRRARRKGVSSMPIIYVWVGMRPGIHGIYAHNGGFVELASAEEKSNLLAAGAREVWVEASTITNLINDARGANDPR